MPGGSAKIRTRPTVNQNPDKTNSQPKSGQDHVYSYFRTGQDQYKSEQGCSLSIPKFQG